MRTLFISSNRDLVGELEPVKNSHALLDASFVSFLTQMYAALLSSCFRTSCLRPLAYRRATQQCERGEILTSMFVSLR